MNKNQPRPQIRTSFQPARTEVHARTHDYLGALPQANSEAEGLIRGLAGLNPVLQQYANRMLDEQRESETKRVQAMAEREKNPLGALKSEGQPEAAMPPAAFDPAYREAYESVLAKRGAIEARDELVRGYEQQKDTEGFDLETFLLEHRARSLSGIKGDRAVSIIGESLAHGEATVRNAALSESVQRHQEDRLTTAHSLTGEFTRDMSPDAIARKHFDWYVPQMRAIQVDLKQAAGMLLARVKTLSDEGGGRPDLFSAFSEKDSEGFTVLDRNPHLADQVATARDQAQRQRDHALKEAKQPALAKLLIGYDDDIRDLPERVTVDRLVSDVASGNIGAEKAAGLYHQAQEELGKKKAAANLELDAERGMLGYYDPKDQNKVLDKMLGVTAKAMWQAAVSGDQRQTEALAQAIMQRHSQTGATVPVDTLQRLMETTVTNLPSPEGPNEKFMASAAVYRALAADPKYRGLYFKDDTDQVMSAFVKHLDGGADAKTAYAAAYRSIDPAFKEQARKRAEAPEMQDKIRGLASKYATGSTMWGWLGGNGRPENQQALGAWAATEVRRALETNPDLTDKELKDHIERKSAENFVLDTTTQLAIKVPPALSGELTQKAMSAYSKSFGETLKAKGQFPDGTVIRYVPLNAEGLYDVQTWTGTRQKSLGQANLKDIVNWHRAATTLTTDEGSQLANLRNALRAGKEIPQVDPALVAKGRSVGFFKDGELAAAEKLNREQVLARLRAVPDFGYGAPTNNSAPLPAKSNARIDAKVTSSLALQLAASPVTGKGFEHIGLAGSLIAMREGVALSAYQDPNPDAGMNIGAGYNLKANAGNVDADLKRAGVPADRFADVKTGKASLTPDQAKRLIEVATPRYESMARKSAEDTAPGLWGRMTPQQRAVMVDIAYQVGDPTVFKKAWAALAAGKTQEFSDETRVFYRNREGVLVEDTRARELRASMLAGVADWQSRVELSTQ